MKIAQTVRLKICQHISNLDSDASCNLQFAYFKNAVYTTAGLGANGDSGSLVLTTDACPSVVGVYIGGNGTYDYVEPISSTLAALRDAGGFSASLSIVPGGAGCQPTSDQVAYYQGLDQDVAQAINPQSDLEAYLSSQPYASLVDGVGMDLSGSIAALDVIVEDGTTTFAGFQVSDADYVGILLQLAFGSPLDFEGVPVKTSTIQTVDLTNAGKF